MALHELVYVSFALRPMPADELVSMLDEFRRFNDEHGITGLLVYHRQEFMQLLEGELQDVQGLYGRICHDPRHQQVHTLWEGPLAARSFDNWSMGFVAPRTRDLLERPGYGDVLGDGWLRQVPRPTRGRRLMMSLRDDFLLGA